MTDNGRLRIHAENRKDDFAASREDLRREPGPHADRAGPPFENAVDPARQH